MDTWIQMWKNYIQGVGMVPGKPEDQNSFIWELGSQLGVMCAVETMESILGITTLIVNTCDNTSTLRLATIHPEAVKSRWKQVDLTSCLSDFYQSMDSGMSRVHIYGHRSSRRPASTLTPLASLNVRLDSLAEHIMASLLISSVKKIQWR